MADKMTKEQRSRCMSHIRATNTKPELVVRRCLWEHGFRYRLHVRKLAGSPDIVMRKHRIVIFVNGCFWHGHNAVSLADGELANSDCCKIPHSNRQFWLDKINRNMERDAANVAKLEVQGWHVLTVWECDLRPKRRQTTLEHLICRINAIIRPIKGYGMPTEEYGIAAEPSAGYGNQPNSQPTDNDIIP